MKQSLVIVAIAVVLGLSSLALKHLGSVGANSEGSLMVYCANGLKAPVEKIAVMYEKETGVKVQLQYGGTGALLSQLEIAGRGDLFIAADETSVIIAREKGLIREAIGLANQYPVIAVAKGNPMGILSVGDLFRDGLKVAVGNPGTASIGKATQRGLGDRWEELERLALVMKPTVTDLAQDLQIGGVDATVIWNSTVPQFEGLEAVRVSEFDKVIDQVSATVLTASEFPQSALSFARYLSNAEKGGKVFAEMNFDPIESSNSHDAEFGN